MHTLLQDLRYAARMLVQAPGFSSVAVLTLALGIGANTAIFTFVNGLLLRPLPYAHPDRLVMVWQDLRARGGPDDEWATPGNYADWRQETRLFERLAAIGGWRPALTGGAEAESLSGEQVSHEYFDVLGIAPVLGRTFTPADDVPGAPRVAIIGDDLWKRRFGGDPAVVGRVVTLGGEAHEIIGVLPAGARPIVNADAEIWRPLRLNTANPARGFVVLRIVARLPGGLTQAQAEEAAGLLAKRLEAAHPDSNERTGITITPLLDRVVGEVRPGLVALLGAVGFVLLIACANIANLLLARGSARHRELAVRMALGAGRARVVRQLLTESTLLAAIGGVAGVLLGTWAVDALVAAAPRGAPRLGEISLDLRVLGFAAALTLVTGVLFGLVPALQAARGDVGASLKEGGGRGQAGGAGRRLRRVLVVAEVALALVLLTGAGLLLQTFVRLQSADLGFRPQGVLVGFFSLPPASYPKPEQMRAFYDQVLQNAAAIPGVQTAALASVLPLSGDSDTTFAIEGRPAATRPGDTPVTWYRDVSASYFDAMGMRIVKGRAFQAGEATPSVVVNEALVRRHFPGEEALGRRIRLDGPDADWFTIIGIVADVRVRGAREDPRIETYIPYWQYTERGMNVILKSVTDDPTRAAEPLRQAVRAVDRNVPVSNVTTLTDIVGESIAQPRVFAALAAAFAVLALVLAAIGLYGVMAYAVAQRTPEIGVRMALGAAPREVFRMVVGDGLWLTALGVVLGVGGSLLVTRWLTTMLFGVRPWDPTTLAGTAAVLLSVAALACLVPARRATRVDPMVALRAN